LGDPRTRDGVCRDVAGERVAEDEPADHGVDAQTLWAVVGGELERVAAYETGAQGWTGVDIVVLTRLQFAVVAFNAAFDESLYPSGARRPSRDRIITEMAAFFVHGTAHRPQ
jgi:hypothetical protein